MPEIDPNDTTNDLPALYFPSYPPPIGFGSDTGLVRPVPNGVIYYVCPAIQPLSAFLPGSPFTVKVSVGNWGGGTNTSLAMVSVWWSPALSGPTLPRPENLIGSASVPVPPFGALSTTPAITSAKSIPEDAPSHICLLARVWHALDRPPTTQLGGKAVEVADPINDRHWGQHNIINVPASGGKSIPFLATNPTAKAARYDLLVQPLSQDKWSSLTVGERFTAVRARAIVRLSGASAEGVGANTVRHRVELKPSEQRIMNLSVDLTEPLQPGTLAAFEVLQLSGDLPVGGFALILRAED